MSMINYSNFALSRSAAAVLFALILISPTSNPFAAGAQGQARHSEAGHGNEASAKGPNGGELTKNAERGVELLLSEEGGAPRLKLWGYKNDKPVLPNTLSVTAELKRPTGETQRVVFGPEGDGLVSTQAIEEPHLFEIEAEVVFDGSGEPLHAIMEKEEGKIAVSAEQIAAAGIKVGVAGSSALEETSQFTGEIKFNADRTAHVVPRMAGIVQSVAADLGQEVKKGDVLATLASSDLSELRSELRAASRRRDLAAQTHTRERRLWQEKVSAEQDYQQARTALEEAQIAVENAQQKLRTVGATASSKDLSLLEIRAPFDGVVVEKHIVLGEAINETSSIFTLSDLRTVWAEFVVAPKDLASVRVGKPATVASTAFAETAHGKVSYVGALLGQQTRAASARVTLENPDMAWRPGLFVSVNVVTSKRDSAVTVQADAVQTVENETAVFVEIPGGFYVQPVKLGKTSGKQAEVLSGLRPGTRYVTDNAFVIKSELGKASAEHAH